MVDRQQVHRTISKEEMLHLFEFGEEENPDAFTEIREGDGHGCGQKINCQVGDSLMQKASLSNGSCSSDKLMEDLLGKHCPRWFYFLSFYPIFSFFFEK